jgi:hypothetical protein
VCAVGGWSKVIDFTLFESVMVEEFELFFFLGNGNFVRHVHPEKPPLCISRFC